MLKLLCVSFDFLEEQSDLSYVLQLLKSEEDASYKPAKKACAQLVDSLVEHILKYEESLSGRESKDSVLMHCFF